MTLVPQMRRRGSSWSVPRNACLRDPLVSLTCQWYVCQQRTHEVVAPFFACRTREEASSCFCCHLCELSETDLRCSKLDKTPTYANAGNMADEYDDLALDDVFHASFTDWTCSTVSCPDCHRDCFCRKKDPSLHL